MFQKIQKKIQKFRDFIKEKGQGTVEYALILGFVAVIAVLIFKSNGLQPKVQQAVNNAVEQGAAVTDLYTAASATS